MEGKHPSSHHEPSGAFSAHTLCVRAYKYMHYNSFMTPISVHPSLLHTVKAPALVFGSSCENSAACWIRDVSGTTRSMITRTVRDHAETTLHAFGIGTSPRWEA
jgi:hypothetical protein